MKGEIPVLTNDGVVSKIVDGPMERAIRSDEKAISRPKPHAALMMGMSRLCILAVENERGYLVPIFTGGDLLFELKKIWRTKH